MDRWYEYVGDIGKSWGVSFAVPQITPPIMSADMPDFTPPELPVIPAQAPPSQAQGYAQLPKPAAQQSSYTVHGQYGPGVFLGGATGRASGILP